MPRQIARGQKSEPQKLDATRDMQPETRLLKPENHNPIFQHSTIPAFQVIYLRQSRLSLTWPRGP
ncbi:MAG: hypothetical protein DRI24_19015, partial [Deltaproteobacteria bacterium]